MTKNREVRYFQITAALILVCLLKRVRGPKKPPVVRLCVILEFFGITGLHIEAQSIGSVIMPIAGICPQRYDTNTFQVFVDEVNVALLRVSFTESADLMTKSSKVYFIIP